MSKTEIICPIMNIGWLVNARSGSIDYGTENFKTENLVDCKKDKCGVWNKDKSRCGFITDK